MQKPIDKSRLPASAESEVFLTEEQVALRWNMSHRTLQNMRLRGQKPEWIKIGRCVRYRLTDIQLFELENTRSFK